MSNILDGMTREQALGCVVPSATTKFGYFVYNGLLYANPEDIIPGAGFAGSADAWREWLNAHCDALEAEKKPKWVEPGVKTVLNHHCNTLTEKIYEGTDTTAEIARTNARRRIEAFIAANGGSGAFYPWWHSRDKQWRVWDNVLIGEGSAFPCLFSCATRELAEEVIRRFEPELRLLAGV